MARTIITREREPRIGSLLFNFLPSACTQSSGGTDRIVQNSYNKFFELDKVTTGFGTADVRDEVTTTYDYGDSALNSAITVTVRLIDYR